MASNEQRGKDALANLEKELAARDRKQKSRPWVTAAASLAVIAALGGGIYFLATQGSEEEVTASEETTTAESAAETTAAESEFDPNEYAALATQRTEALPATVNCEYSEDGRDEHFIGLPPTEGVSAEGTVTVELDTTEGPIGMELDRSVSPCTVNAIEYLAADGYFNDTVCHRLTTGDGLKVLQCGDPSGTGAGGPGFQFANEFPTDEELATVDDSQLGLPEGISDQERDQYRSMMLQSDPKRYERGTIAMANAGVGTNGSQFFLNYGPSILPPLYTYFGMIDDAGLATLDAIAAAGVEGGASDGTPAKEVRIKTATVR
ncbi:peptidylprolyl isomerase [Corynebacterium aquatimens]|uniref:peptidylprolyl isomerase n=1 Tax=Corynebacterium TaxID=1716 RepID=UPI001F1F2856|nr:MULTISPECIES: peptidylprolyl isomerase [Corynebacterium]QYH19663.1 peptidylprolyl isomerase [Corynebacterium aquatimens]UIZ91344.1 peptidylprolyl isomerase [Corynebacterium sp. CNCTC7651]